MASTLLWPMKILKKIDGIAEDFKYSLENTITQLNKKEGLPTKRHKPSNLNCMRKMYYIISGAEANKFPVSPELTRICENGTDSHLRIQYYVSNIHKINPDIEWVNVADYVKEHNLNYLEIKYQKEYETHLYHKELNISFLCDGLLKIKGKYYILEIKTENSYSFNKRIGVDNKHKFQATCYSALLQVPDVLFIYENRDVCSKKYYTIHITDTERNNIINRIKTCDNFIARHQLPEKEINAQCGYCEYLNICNKNYNPPKTVKLF